MTTITREWLQSQISSIEAVGITDSNTLAAFKLALASLDAEPVAWVVHARTGDQLTSDGGYVANAEGILGLHSTPLYAAPPAHKVSGEYGDAYQGAREDLAIWKRRALEAEERARQLEQINDHLVKEAQGEHRFGEPVIRESAPASVPGLKSVGFLFVSDDGAVAYSPTDWSADGFNLIGPIYGNANVCRGMTGPVIEPYKPPENSFTNEELEGMAVGNNPQSNAYRELLSLRRNSPVAPDELPEDCEFKDSYIDGCNACRAAMLNQGRNNG